MFGKKKIKELKEDKTVNVKQDLPETNKEKEVPLQERETKKGVANATNNFEYDIELWDVWDTTSKRLPVFGANRVIENNNVYLFNEKTGFKVPFPENSEEYKQYKLEELEDIIKKIEKNITLVKQNKKDLSLRDLQKNLRIHRNYKRSLELQGRGSYMVVNHTGRPMFMFDRIGNLKMPLFKNVDRSLIYTPTEQKTQEVTQLLKENAEKNGEEKRISLATYALILILAITTCFLFYMVYKTSGVDIEVVNALSNVASVMADITKDLNSVSSSMYNITESIRVDPDLITTPASQTVTGR